MADGAKAGPTTPDVKVPVVCRIDLKDPASFLVAQNSPVRNKDVVICGQRAIGRTAEIPEHSDFVDRFGERSCQSFSLSFRALTG